MMIRYNNENTVILICPYQSQLIIRSTDMYLFQLMMVMGWNPGNQSLWINTIALIKYPSSGFSISEKREFADYRSYELKLSVKSLSLGPYEERFRKPSLFYLNTIVICLTSTWSSKFSKGQFDCTRNDFLSCPLQSGLIGDINRIFWGPSYLRWRCKAFSVFFFYNTKFPEPMFVPHIRWNILDQFSWIHILSPFKTL